MNAQEALKISESNKPLVVADKYKSIMDSIERAVKMGRTDIVLGYAPPNQDIIDRLDKDGFWVYSIGDNWLLPKMYGISWKKEERKKKWWQKLLNS